MEREERRERERESQVSRFSMCVDETIFAVIVPISE